MDKETITKKIEKNRELIGRTLDSDLDPGLVRSMINNLSNKNENLLKQLNGKSFEELYKMLSEDIKHQISFLDDYYEFDINHLIKTLNELKIYQDKIKSKAL